MHRHILTAILAFAAAAAPCARAGVLNFEGDEATSVGIYVKDLKTGKVIVDENSRVALTPASVMKCVTTATALEKLGPDYRFTTRVALAGKRDRSQKSRWEGDLVIFSSGDPTLESDQFKFNRGFTDSIVASIRRAGISELTGSIVIVETMSDQGPVPQWEVEDIAWPYGAGLYGFNYAGNYVRALPNKGTTVPASNLKFNIEPQRDGDGTDLIRGAGANDVTIWASAKTRKNSNWSVNVTVPDPAKVYAGVLINALRRAGIKHGTKPDMADRDDALTIYTHRSPRAEEIMRNLMKRSDNLFAEGMLRAIDSDGSRSDCIKTEKAFWKEQGLDSKNTLIRDGSGLTRGNRISPRFLGGILEHMANGRYGEMYASFMPVAGIDGTLKSFLRKTRLKGRLAMKTGSVAAVQCYAGYKLDWEGNPTHVVVVMVNGFFCPRAALRGSIEKFLLKTFE